MKISDQKDLAKLIKLCRQTGVQSIRVDGIELHLGAEPRPAAKRSRMPKVESDGKTQGLPSYRPDKTVDEILSDGILTQDQMLFYSVTDAPDASAAEPN